MIKIEQKIGGNDRVAIVKFKTFDDVQNLYEVISIASNDYDNFDDFDDPLIYDGPALVASFANSIVIAKVITKKPILYLVEEDEWGTYDSITGSINDLCRFYVKELKDKDTPEFTKIAKQYINAHKKLKTNGTEIN